MTLDLTKCVPECRECIQSYIKKHGLQKGDTFKIVCTGIPKDPVPPEVLEANPDLDRETAIAMVDPVAWAARYLDWHCLDPIGEVWKRKTETGETGEFLPYSFEEAALGKSPYHRPYQALMLRCSSRRRVLRAGRQIGKSAVIQVNILYHLFTKQNFNIVLVVPYQSQVDLIFKGMETLLENSSLKNSVSRYVKSPNYKLEINNGSCITGFTAGSKSGHEAGVVRGSSAHLLCCAPGTLVNTTEFAIKPIEDLTISDTVCGGNSEDIFVGDVLGLYKHASEVITVSTPLTSLVVTPDHPVFDGEKDVPAIEAKEAIVSLSHQEISFREDAILARLTGYSFGDGYINPENEIAFFYGAAADLEQISEDIVYIGGRKCTGEDKLSENRELGIIGTCAAIGSHWAWRLLKDFCPVGKKVYQQLTVPSWIKTGSTVAKRNFLSGLFSAEGSEPRLQKNQKTPCAIELRTTSSKEDWIRSWINEIADLITEQGIQISNILIKNVEKTINKKKEPRWSGTIRLSNSIENTQAFFERIGFVYSVKKRQRANEWKLYRWYQTNSNPSFSEKTLPELISCLTKIKEGYVKLPVFQNTSKISRPSIVYNLTSSAAHRFFGNGCLTHNCFDEADYLSRKDLESALATVANFPLARIWMSSTPTGKREKFWESSFNPMYREFYYPSYVNPNWSQELEDYFRGEYTEEAYNHEILAIFSDQEEGVFKNKYISAAQDDFEYGDYPPRADWMFTIGVDWNDYKIGTTISIVGWNPIDNQFYVVYKEIITSQQLTQLTACQRIADLNKVWNPISIYVDRGYGCAQLEVLKKFGMDAMGDKARGPKHPDAKLLRIVKGYDFGGSIETHDPFTKLPIKKPAKPFLVENAVRRFETYSIKYPKSDKKFTMALQGYIIKRVSPTGQPLYVEQNDKVGDHFIDAVNLALVAFTLEKSDFGKPKIYSEIFVSDCPLMRAPPVQPVSDPFGLLPKEETKKPARFKPNRTEPHVNTKDTNATEKPKPGLWAWPGFMRDEPAPRLTKRGSAKPAVGNRWNTKTPGRRGRY